MNIIKFHFFFICYFGAEIETTALVVFFLFVNDLSKKSKKKNILKFPFKKMLVSEANDKSGRQLK